MKKSRILSLAMAGALCFSLLAGCGGSGGTASSPAPETTSPETGAPESTAPAGGSTSAFKLGGTGPLTEMCIRDSSWRWRCVKRI